MSHVYICIDVCGRNITAWETREAAELHANVHNSFGKNLPLAVEEYFLNKEFKHAGYSRDIDGKVERV